MLRSEIEDSEFQLTLCQIKGSENHKFLHSLQTKTSEDGKKKFKFVQFSMITSMWTQMTMEVCSPSRWI